MNQYKYLSLNLQKTLKFTSHLDSLKLKMKNMNKITFFLN
jgi:hypothetical protein